MRVLVVSILLFITLSHGVSEDIAKSEPGEQVLAVQVHSVADNFTEFPGQEQGIRLSRFSGQCPFGWYGHQARCYQFVNQANTWINAQEYCMGIGANLASARNPREYLFLQELLNDVGRTTIAWLGGFYLQGTWLWMDGEGFYYENWYSLGSAYNYPCLYMRNTVGWSHTTCNSARYPFICVKRTC